MYETEQGLCPCERLFESLEPKLKAKVFRMIKMLEANGPYLREPYSKCIEKGLYELRIKQGSNIVRVLFFYSSNNSIILINGFVKKTQKTPKLEIKLAMKYKNDYERRCDNEKF